MRRPVWDALVRGLHWTLAGAVATAWISGHWAPADFDAVHHTAGYVALAAVAARLAWGLIEPRYVGHNPLGGWMAVLLWSVAAGVAVTGWLYTTEWLWGYAWLEALHLALGWLIAALVAGHLGGVVVTSWRHRENLVAAMFSGSKRAPEGTDID